NACTQDRALGVLRIREREEVGKVGRGIANRARAVNVIGHRWSPFGGTQARRDGGWVYEEHPPPSRERLHPLIVSRNSSTALPTRFSRWMSRTVRSGWATYQPTAGIWCETIQSFTLGLRIPGQPSQAVKMTSIWSVILVAKSSI